MAIRGLNLGWLRFVKIGFVRPRSRRPTARTTCVRLPQTTAASRGLGSAAALAALLGFVWGVDGPIVGSDRWHIGQMGVSYTSRIDGLRRT